MLVPLKTPLFAAVVIAVAAPVTKTPSVAIPNERVPVAATPVAPDGCAEIANLDGTPLAKSTLVALKK